MFSGQLSSYVNNVNTGGHVSAVRGLSAQFSLNLGDSVTGTFALCLPLAVMHRMVAHEAVIYA